MEVSTHCGRHMSVRHTGVLPDVESHTLTSLGVHSLGALTTGGYTSWGTVRRREGYTRVLRVTGPTQ